MFVKMPWIRKKIRGFCYKLFSYLENNGDCNFAKNGEAYFLDSLFHQFSAQASIERVMFDIGANIGEYSELLLQKAKKKSVTTNIHAFEPTNSCYEIISRKIGTKIKINKFGVSEVAGSSQIYYDKEMSGLGSLYQRDLSDSGMVLDCSEKIELRRLDTYIDEQNISHIHFVKIDIEGHELSGLKSFGDYLSGDFIDYIQFEYGGTYMDSHTTLRDIYRLLSQKGFKIGKILRTGVEIREYLPFMENMNYANFVAISEKIINTTDCGL